MSAIPLSTIETVEEPVSLWRDAWYRLKRNRLAIFGLVVVVILAFTAIFGPYLTPYDYLSQDLNARNVLPSMSHLFGTDDLGRDVFSRVVFGTRTAFLVAVIVTVFAVLIGLVLGAVAGFFGNPFDRAIMWLTDVTMSVPNLLLVVVINASLKSPISKWMEARYLATLNPFYRETMWVDFILVFGSMALISWPPYARLVRAQVLSIRSRPYITAAQALGLSNWIIIKRYVIPNALGPLIVSVSAGLGTAMVLESAFSFLGVGVNPPTPSWGNMISDGLRVWQHYPHLLAAPAAVLGLASVAFSFLGDGLNDALNPRGSK
ncbi:ABC transporter permease (plasmid) [Rhizobium leguminosarum]|jgi:peptide/nickel transport system permease protein|uniref:Peptide ABC transporter n=3 Tax=Rhizobium TaxID=379 RepID=A0A1B8R131_RHILT|nr:MULTISPECIES: ABC transporter permease [Rhizobium]AOO94928.1 peptide ABC transporter [Rhizobium leguminosarum bv. trifolii]ASS59872.1 ABC transporter permease [Rhizobium leguminosarum bv. viciae]AVC46127.1 N-terminal TM domain of oligopeptide transport permease C family protein [Rhizobium leguminosarum bv. viciae]AXA43988.1 Binding-protein-dependent transport system inner membrane component family protein [Rhizobium leguminosarum]MBA8832701.1 peptide/nickel transport system permease protein